MVNMFEAIPKNIKRFRFENSLLYVKANDDRVDFIVKNVETESHIHFFKHGLETGMVLTNEDKRGMKGEHHPIQITRMFSMLGDLYSEFWKMMERVEPDDHRFDRKKVILISTPQPYLEKIKDGKAYVELHNDVKKTRFSDIDPFEVRFGCVVNWLGFEKEMLIVRGGEIYTIEIKKLNQLLKSFRKKHSSEFHTVA